MMVKLKRLLLLLLWTCACAPWTAFAFQSGLFLPSRAAAGRRRSLLALYDAPPLPTNLTQDGSEILSETTAASYPNAFTPDTADESLDVEPEGVLGVEEEDVQVNNNEKNDDVECLVGTPKEANCLPLTLVTLPRHSHPGVCAILEQTEQVMQRLHTHSKFIELSSIEAARAAGKQRERIYANNYVDLGKIDT